MLWEGGGRGALVSSIGTGEIGAEHGIRDTTEHGHMNMGRALPWRAGGCECAEVERRYDAQMKKDAGVELKRKQKPTNLHE